MVWILKALLYQYKLLQNYFWFSCHRPIVHHEGISAMWIVCLFNSWYNICFDSCAWWNCFL